MTNTNDRADVAAELLPCPFCGAKPFLKRIDDVVGISCGEASDCNKTGLCIVFHADKQETAVAAWNRRAAISSAVPDGAHMVTLDRRDVFDFVRGAIKSSHASSVAASLRPCVGPQWARGSRQRRARSSISSSGWSRTSASVCSVQSRTSPAGSSPRSMRRTAASAQRSDFAASASGTGGPIAPAHPASARCSSSGRPAESGSGTTMRGCSYRWAL